MSKFNKVGQFLPSRFCIISTNFTRINAFPIIRSISLSNANILVVISFRINTNFIQFIYFFFFSVSPAKFAYNVSFTSFYLILIHFMEMYIRLQNKYHQPTKTNHVDWFTRGKTHPWQRVALKLINVRIDNEKE